jgi:hypothetical protein
MRRNVQLSVYNTKSGWVQLELSVSMFLEETVLEQGFRVWRGTRFSKEQRH